MIQHQIVWNAKSMFFTPHHIHPLQWGKKHTLNGLKSENTFNKRYLIINGLTMGGRGKFLPLNIYQHKFKVD